MAIASAKAAPKSMGTNSLLVDSGLRPMDSMALETIMPTAYAGEIPPIAMVAPLTIRVIDSSVTLVKKGSVDCFYIV